MTSRREIIQDYSCFLPVAGRMPTKKIFLKGLGKIQSLYFVFFGIVQRFSKIHK